VRRRADRQVVPAVTVEVARGQGLVSGSSMRLGARRGRNHMSRLSFYLAYPPRARNARGPRRWRHGFAEVTGPASGGEAIPGCA
jgi:hypothetical protein